jgi:hypothetical protein
MQVGEVATLVIADLHRHIVHHAEWIGAKEVLDAHEVDEILKKCGFEG